MFIEEQIVTEGAFSVAIDVIYALGYHVEPTPGTETSWDLFRFISGCFIGEFNSLIDVFDYLNIRVPMGATIHMVAWESPYLH